MIRIEFKARGSPHAHTILWIKGVPKLDVNTDEEIVAFINRHQTCAIPGEEESDLRQLVFSVQKHSATCRKSGSWFHFPHYLSAEIVIARQPGIDDSMAAECMIIRQKQISSKKSSKSWTTRIFLRISFLKISCKRLKWTHNNTRKWWN